MTLLDAVWFAERHSIKDGDEVLTSSTRRTA
jgi:hypothetical protein